MRLRVVTRRQIPFFDIGIDISARYTQERTDDVAGLRPHRAQSGQSAAAQQVQQHRFRLVVLMMGYGNRRGPQTVLFFAKQAVPLSPADSFQRRVLLRRQCRHVCPAADKGAGPLLRFLPYKPDLLVGGLPNAVMDVAYGEMQVIGRPQPG